MDNITKEYLKSHPNEIFVFGDNTLHWGKKGAAELRDEPNAYGFITKKKPFNQDKSHYTPEEYQSVYEKELEALKVTITLQPDKTFLISKLGSGLANRFGIFEKIIEPRIKEDLKNFNNVKFLW